MKKEIITEEGKRYLKIPFYINDGKTEFLSEYEINILETNTIKGIAKVTRKKSEGEIYFLFSVSASISLKEKFDREYLNISSFRNLFKELLQVYKNMKTYLLDTSMICLKPEYIFYDEKEGQYIFMPVDEQSDSVAEKYENLLTFFADICSVDEKNLLEFIFESFSSLNESGFDEEDFIKRIIHHKYEKQVEVETENIYEEQLIEEEEIEETPKMKGTLIISGLLIVLAFGLSFVCREEFKYSVAGMAACLLAVGLMGYEVSKKVIQTFKHKTT